MVGKRRKKQKNLPLVVGSGKVKMTNKISNRDLVVAKKFGRTKLIRASTKLYNNLCQDCKRNVLGNPKMDVNNYCPGCQDHIKEFQETFRVKFK